MVLPIHKPTTKLALPSDFPLVENCSASADIISLAEKAVEESVKTEFIISLARCGLPHGTATAGSLPPWRGIHALITSHDVPLMCVGFLPVIPSPVTEYATVRKALQNFQACRKQLNQDTIAVVSDEGVYHTVIDIIMNEPETFKDVFPMLGMSHFVKVLLRCAGRYISGSGLDDTLIECGGFGPKTLSTGISGGHYVQSFKGMLIVSEVIDSLKWSAFWAANDTENLSVQHAIELRNALTTKQRNQCLKSFDNIFKRTAALQKEFDTYMEKCQERSELCKFLMNFQKIKTIIKHFIASDRDGNWPLHVGTVKASMKIFREFDAINYLRYASWYLEKIQTLEETCPTLYRRFSMGQSVVKDRAGAMFAAVAGDMKLEQTQNRFSQGPGGHVIVGSSGDTAAVAEFGLLFHEILSISNLLQTLTNARLTDHLETSIHHELSGRSGIIFDENVYKLLDFVKARENPFVVEVSPVPLHNIMTKHR